MSTSGVGRIERLVAIGAVIAAGATLPLWAGSAEEVGSDYVVSAESGEEYTVTDAIDRYARVVKKGTGTVILRTTTTEYAGDVVIEDGKLYIETAGTNELRLNGALTRGSTSTSDILFRKRGTGVLYLNGDVDLSCSVQIDQGLMEMNSAASRVYRTGFILKGDGRSLIGDGHALFNWIRAGNDGRGVFHQTGGILGATGETAVGMNAADVGHWAMSGGEAYMSNNVYVAHTAGSFGSFIQTGGLFKLDGGVLRASRAGTALFHLAGGTNDTRVTQGGSNVRFYLSDYGGSSDVTVSGEGTLLATEALRFGGGDGTISTNIFNVKDGGTVKAARFFKHQGTGAASLIVVNADGGTLMPTYGYDWTNGGLDNSNYCPSHFVIWKKGLVIDTSESTGNNPASQMPFTFAPPTGKGVASITLPTSGDYTTASYIGPARIVFEDESGWGASAYAEYDFATKSHTGVVITSRGCDFSDNAKAYVESPDRTTRWECALTLTDNAGLCGEVIKRGQNDLYLYAANTTTGGIAVESGTLHAESTGVVPTGTPLRAEYGATMAFAVSTPLTLSTFSGAGSVTGCDITVTDAVRATCEEIFADKFATFAGKLTFAEGAVFEISDPENLRQYMRSGFKTAFQAQQVLGSPVLRLAGSESCGNWALIRKPDGTYKFGAHAGMIIVIK